MRSHAEASQQPTRAVRGSMRLARAPHWTGAVWKVHRAHELHLNPMDANMGTHAMMRMYRFVRDASGGTVCTESATLPWPSVPPAVAEVDPDVQEILQSWTNRDDTFAMILAWEGAMSFLDGKKKEIVEEGVRAELVRAMGMADNILTMVSNSANGSNRSS